MMRYYVIRLWEERTGDGNWAHLYPRQNGERPKSFTFEGAEEYRERLFKMFGSTFRIIPETDFDKYEVPRRY